MNITALFAGIGGLELGLHASGHRTSLFCEIDPDASAVLARQFPEVVRTPDVRDIQCLLDQISPDSNLLTAGFPCTDFSQAGLTQGFAGKQSSLILDVLRLLKQRPFDAVLIENVPNWRMLHGGTYLRHVLGALERLGYRWAYRTVDSLAFGIPQRRLRLFLFASLKSDPRNALFHGDVPPRQERYELDEAAHGFYWTEGLRGLGWGEDCVPTLKGGSTIGIPSPPAILLTNGDVITPDIRDAERLQGFAPDWTDLSNNDSPRERGGPNPRKRWSLVGNAVNVETSKWLGERIVEDLPYTRDDGRELTDDAALPSAAWYDGSVRRGVYLSPWPVERPKVSLEAFLGFEGKPLSHRAARGFLKRAVNSNLRFSPGFLESIRSHIQKFDEGETIELPARHQAALALG